MKAKGFREKHALREATKDVLMDEVYDRQKHPFTAPPAAGPDDPMMAMFADVLSSRALDDQPIFDPGKVRLDFEEMKNCPPTGAPPTRLASSALCRRRSCMSGSG